MTAARSIAAALIRERRAMFVGTPRLYYAANLFYAAASQAAHVSAQLLVIPVMEAQAREYAEAHRLLSALSHAATVRSLRVPVSLGGAA